MKRKIAAILAADIAGYSKLVAEDEEETLRRLASYRSVFDDFIAKASGRIFNTAGDAVLAEFPSAVEAVRCAIDIQESLRTRNMAYPPSRQMNFRMGITIGDVVERDGDLLGDGVNIAARLESLAEPGGICVSRTIYEQVTNKISVRFADIGEQQVKNIPTPIHAYVVASPHDKPHTLQKSKSAKLAIAATLAGVVLVGGAGGVYWALKRTPQTGASTATPAVKAPSPPTVVAEKPAAPTQAPAPPAVAAGTSPAPAQPPAPAAPVPARFNEANVRALAAQQNIPLPRTIHIVEPSAAAPKKVTEYLGAWGGDRRWGSRGRQMILFVTNVDETGKATGIASFGPPTPYTINQNPANFWSFTGTIRDSDLKFESANGKFKYEFRIMPDGVMEGHLETPINTHPTITIERIN